MAEEVATARLLRFGVFELDLETGELRKAGKRVRLAPQPFRLLVLLTRKPGELVTREEIQQEIWGDGTVVDFEQGLRFLVKKTRAALGDHSQSPRYIETLPRRGYRFIAPIKAATPGTEWENGPVMSTPRWGHRSWVIGAGLAAVVALGLTFNLGGLRDRVAREFPRHIQSIAVRPVENLSGDPEQEYFADGMTDELITELSRISSLRVIGRASVMSYKGSTKPIRQIAHELNVDAVMEASVLRSGNRVLINARLVDGETDSVLWTQAYERNLGDILALHSEVASDVARRIRITVTPEEQQRLASTRSVNPQAYEAYLRGRYLFNKRTGEDIRKAIDNFEQAVQIDPNYAPAYAGIADAYVQLEYYGPIAVGASSVKAREAARKAVRLDKSLAEGHTALALVSFRYRLDWNKAEKEFRQAIALNPGYATAHHRYGVFLMYLGRNEEAFAEVKKAQKLEPLSLIINTSLGTILFMRGDYDLAIKQWESTRELDPGFWIARFWLGFGLLTKGSHKKGLHELETAVELSKGNPSALAWFGYGYAISGETARAHEILARLQQKAKQEYVPSYEFAVVHAGLGEKDQAFKYLEKAFQERNVGMFYLGLKHNLFWPSLHSDPRYQVILRRMNFPS